MADQGDDDRTEQASEKRLQHAWDEGEIPLGRDAVAVAALFAGAFALMSLAGPLRDALVALVVQGLGAVGRGGEASGHGAEGRVALLALGVAAAAAAGATAASLAQTRGGFWPHLAGPDLSRLANGRLGKIFSKDGLLDLAIAALKVGVIFAAVSGGWRVRFLALEGLVTAPATSLLDAGAAWLLPLAKRLGFAVLLLGGMDLAVNQLRFAKRMKMTREEAKRESREEEGDPLIRGKRRRRHRELIKNRAATAVPKADAVLVNPTHVAVAIRYRAEGGAPRVIAKGKGRLAEVIRELARENGIPIVENIALARLLYRRVKVGREIPAETYKAVAAILAFVYRLTGRRAGAAASA